MSKSKKFEVFGTLQKDETIFTIKDKIIPGTMVFESLAPFPGYFNEAPNESKPTYLYLGLDDDYSVSDIYRAAQNVREQMDVDVDVAKATVMIYDMHYHVLRLRHIEDYDLIKPIQEALQEEGLRPKFVSGKVKEGACKIHIIKFICMEKVAKGIYLDCGEPDHAYITIPKHMSWDDFEEVTKQVKYNWYGSKFDAAQGSFYRKGRLREFVRVYSKKINENYLKEVCKLYLTRIK